MLTSSFPLGTMGKNQRDPGESHMIRREGRADADISALLTSFFRFDTLAVNMGEDWRTVFDGRATGIDCLNACIDV